MCSCKKYWRGSGIPFTQFPQLMTSGKATEQCHPQDTDLDAVKIQSVPITIRCLKVPFITSPTWTSTTPTLITPGQRLTGFYFCNFVTSKMLYKWNHRACRLFRLAPFTQQTFWRFS